jgi:hypothetical protein
MDLYYSTKRIQRKLRLVTSHKPCLMCYTSLQHSKFRGRVIRITQTFVWPGQYTNTCILGYRMAEYSHNCFIKLGIKCFRSVKLCYLKLRTQRDDLLQDRLSVTKWSRMTYFKIGPSLLSNPATHWSFHWGKRSRSDVAGTSLDFPQHS